jgi:hypothetical protein
VQVHVEAERGRTEIDGGLVERGARDQARADRLDLQLQLGAALLGAKGIEPRVAVTRAGAEPAQRLRVGTRDPAEQLVGSGADRCGLVEADLALVELALRDRLR